MVVQKLEAQHDAGSVESAGGEDENVNLGTPSQTNPIKYPTEQREAFRDRLPTMSSQCRLKPQRHLQPHNGSCCVTVKVQNTNVPCGNVTRSGETTTCSKKKNQDKLLDTSVSCHIKRMKKLMSKTDFFPPFTVTDCSHQATLTLHT